MDNLTASYQEVEDFFAELLDSKTLRAKKYLIYNTYKEAVNKNKLVSDIEYYLNTRNNNPKCKCSVQIPNENDNYAIITWAYENGLVAYSYCFFDIDTHKVIQESDMTWQTFEDAYLGVICEKSKLPEAFVWIKRLLDTE